MTEQNLVFHDLFTRYKSDISFKIMDAFVALTFVFRVFKDASARRKLLLKNLSDISMVINDFRELLAKDVDLGAITEYEDNFDFFRTLRDDCLSIIKDDSSLENSLELLHLSNRAFECLTALNARKVSAEL